MGVAPTAANSEALNFFHSLEGPFQSTNDATALSARADYQFGGGSRLALRYNFSDGTAENAASVGGAADTLTTSALSNNGTEKDRSHTGLAQLTNILTPSIFNDVRFNYTYELRPRLANSAEPSVSAGPIGLFGTRSFLPTTEDDKRIQITDSVSIVHGAHTLKFGGDYNYASAGQIFGFNQFGTFSFTTSDVPTILRLLSGTGTNGTNRFDDASVQYRRQIGNLTADFHLHQIAFYGQDSWRVSPKLLLNFGLRWEGQVNGQPEANNTAVIQAVQAMKFPLGVTLDPTKFPNALNQVMPRFGFTYSPLSRTVIRGHAGIFYASTPMLVLAGPENNFRVPAGDLSIALLNSGTNTVYKQLLAVGVDLNKFPIDQLPNIDPATVAKAASGGGSAVDPFSGASFTGLANDFLNPRAIQAGLGADQEVAHNFVVGIQFNYVNTVHLERNHDYNLNPPSVIDASGRPIYTQPRPLSKYSIFTIRESSARSMYRGMTLSSRYTSGRFQFGAFYTASQTYSNDDNERDASGFSYNDPYNLKLDYGYSNLDARHQFSGNALVSLPWGIELSGIYHFRSGLPINPAAGSDVNKDGSSTGDRAQQSPGKLFDRNSFRNTAFNDVDLRFLKTFRFGERVKLQFSTEMFNLFNFSNVIIAGRNLNYGVGVNAQGQTVAPNSTFRQLKLANGTYDTVNTQVGFPFQAQFGLRLFF